MIQQKVVILLSVMRYGLISQETLVKSKERASQLCKIFPSLYFQTALNLGCSYFRVKMEITHTVHIATVKAIIQNCLLF